MEGLLIGQLASATDVPIATIRYYERRGLLRDPRRTAGGYRIYEQEALSEVAFIRGAKRLGFSLSEISDLLELRHQPADVCGQTRARASATIRRIEVRIEELTTMRDELARLAQSCRAQSRTAECPIIESLEDNRDAHG